MQKRFVPTICGLAGLALAAPAVAQDFEGTVTTRSITADVEVLRAATGGAPSAILALPLEELLQLPDVEVQQFTHYLKGSKFRSQPQGESEDAPYVIVDYGRGVFQTVQPSERTYIEWTRQDIEQVQADMMGQGPRQLLERPGKRPSIRATGETRMIRGVRCAGYEVRTDEQLVVAWVTADHAGALRAFQGFMREVERMNPRREVREIEPAELFMERGLPMLTQDLGLYADEADGEYDVEEVLTIEAQPLPDGLFEPPAGYRRVSAKEMMREVLQRMQERRPPTRQ